MSSVQPPKQSIDKLMAKYGISNDQRKMVQNVVLLHALMEVKSHGTKRLAELGIECLAAMNRAIDNDVLDMRLQCFSALWRSAWPKVRPLDPNFNSNSNPALTLILA